MDSSRPVYIYALVDPRLKGIRRFRYVGKTIDLEKRLGEHLAALRLGKESNKRKAKWLQRLLDAGLTPGIEVLEETTESNWQAAERRIIADLRARGGRLTNASAGGDGVLMPRTPEWKARIGAAHRGKKVSHEARERIREANRKRYAADCKQGHPWTPENTRWVNIKDRDGSIRIARTCRICSRAKTDRWRMANGHQVGVGRGGVTKPKPACGKGHAMEGANIYVSPDGRRYCVACSRERSRDYKRRKYQPATMCRNGLHLITEENARYSMQRGKLARGCLPCFQEKEERYHERRLELERARRQHKREITPPRTCCKEGHEYTAGSHYVASNGRRRCLICLRAHRTWDKAPR